MTPRLRKLMLTLHVASSIGWIGALAAFLALAVTGMASGDPQLVRACYVANALITWTVIVPLALASLLTGIVQALATPWGLLRHFWIVFKLMIVVAATALLLVKTGQIDQLAALAATGQIGPGSLAGMRASMIAHAAGGLVVLLWATALGTYKPAGLTRYGWLRQQSRREGERQ